MEEIGIRASRPGDPNASGWEYGINGTTATSIPGVDPEDQGPGLDRRPVRDGISRVPEVCPGATIHKC